MLRRPRSLTLRLAGVACLTALASVPAVASAATGPVQRSFPGAFSYTLVNGGFVDPKGANDWTCKPTKARPRPVVLVHGTFENAYSNFAFMSPELKASGFCVYAINYSTKGASFGLHGTGPEIESAKELAGFVDRVLTQTGATKVDIVGHSQGGAMPRAYMKYFGGVDRQDPSRNKVGSLVSLGSPPNGTDLLGLVKLAQFLGYDTTKVPGALGDVIVGSPFTAALNADGTTERGVAYTSIYTKYDELSTPWQAGAITDNRVGAEVHNILLQDGCATNFAEHLSMSYSARSIWFVRRALGVQQPGKPLCDVQLPLV